MEGVEISAISLLGENENGKTYELSAIPAQGIMVAYRKQGSVSGNHYHKGDSMGKNPEKLLLISGQINLYVQNIESKEEENHTISSPALVQIHSGILHTVTALSDIAFVEFNSLEEHKSDTYYLD